MTVVPHSPYAVVYDLVVLKAPDFRPGTRAAIAVARAHIIKTRPMQKRLYQHFSTAALTIWLTRNWTAQQLAAAAYPMLKHAYDYRACGIGRTYPPTR